jgi:excinuclease UvrABC helicase subunit UvrB
MTPLEKLIAELKQREKMLENKMLAARAAYDQAVVQRDECRECCENAEKHLEKSKMDVGPNK